MAWHWTIALWIPAFWLWQILRHEGAHALAAFFTGYDITAFVFWPHVKDGRFYWGRVDILGPLPIPDVFWLAPYYADLVAAFAGALVMILVPLECYWLTFTFVMLTVSPLVDVAWNVWKFLHRNEGDIAEAVKLR